MQDRSSIQDGKDRKNEPDCGDVGGVVEPGTTVSFVK